MDCGGKCQVEILVNFRQKTKSCFYPGHLVSHTGDWEISEILRDNLGELPYICTVTSKFNDSAFLLPGTLESKPVWFLVAIMLLLLCLLNCRHFYLSLDWLEYSAWYFKSLYKMATWRLWKAS